MAETTTPVPTATPRCDRCDAPLPAGTGPGQCPNCLLGLAMTPPSPAKARAGSAPAIAALQPLFPGYELQELLGRGGMGAVYRARHCKLDRLVAIKVLLPDLVQDPAFAERFEREAKALARLDHHGIVGIHDFGRAGEFFYLVMEFVDGASLRDLLAQGQLTARDVLAFVPQLCDALQYAHDHRIVHRDIKPENILVDQEGRVRIADFGLAKLLGQDAHALGITQTAQALGTPHYMAPEQVHAANQVDHRADLYSLGVVLYEMLTGQLPIGRFQPPSAKAAGARAFDPVVMRTLENDPAQRYQTAREVKRDLQAAESEQQATAAAATPAALRKRDAKDDGTPSPAKTMAKPEPGTLPWHALIGTATILLASVMPWLRFTLGSSYDFAIAGARTFARGNLVGTAWTTSLRDVPLWLAVVFAVVACILSVRRARGKPWHLVPLVPAGSGLLMTCYTMLRAIAMPGLYVGIGLMLATITFAVWTAIETRHEIGQRPRRRFWHRRR